MKNNKLSDGELFILLKIAINANETDKALKLANMIQVRFNELLTEVDKFNNVVHLYHLQNEIIKYLCEDEFDD